MLMAMFIADETGDSDNDNDGDLSWMGNASEKV